AQVAQHPARRAVSARHHGVASRLLLKRVLGRIRTTALTSMRRDGPRNPPPLWVSLGSQRMERKAWIAGKTATRSHGSRVGQAAPRVSLASASTPRPKRLGNIG